MYCQEGGAAWLEGAPERVGELHGDGTWDPLSRPQSLRLDSEASPGLVRGAPSNPPITVLTFPFSIPNSHTGSRVANVGKGNKPRQRGSLIPGGPHSAQSLLPSVILVAKEDSP